MKTKYILDLKLPGHRCRKSVEYEIDEKGCWICVSHARNSYGYPLIRINGRLRIMSCVIYEHYYGELGNLFVCHKCDNPGCINPDHLFAGTHAENMRDMEEKGRAARGENSGLAKLTEDDVIYIRSSKLSQQELAKKFGVDQSYISDIQLGKSWRHLPGTRFERRGYGENGGRAKLTKGQVLKIRELYRSGKYLQYEIAKMFGVRQSLISYIVNNKRWSYLFEPAEQLVMKFGKLSAGQKINQNVN